MKQASLLLICIASLTSIAQARPLKRGMSGKDVKDWQIFLRQRGFGLPANGKFGPATENATFRFQQIWNVYATGIVDARTLNRAREFGFGVTSANKEKQNHKSASRPNGLVFGDFVVSNVSTEGGFLVGTVTNTSNYNYNSVTIYVNLYDLDGNRFGDSKDSIGSIEPHRSWRFRVLNTTGGTAKYKIANIKFMGRV